MKISKMSNVPDWFNYTAKPKVASVTVVASPSVSPVAPEQVDELVLASECDKIEKCASENKEYFYNKNWTQEHIAHLKEYALACSIPSEKIIAAELEVKASTEVVVKTASTQASEVKTTEAKKTIDLGDAFGIDKRLAEASREKQDWQVNKPEAKLSQAPIMQGIIPIRGGESQLINNTPKLAINQNSIGNSKAIENIANSEVLDTGARLAQERKDRQNKRAEDNKQWEQNKIDEMPMRHIVAKGNVFPTEALNAQPGLGNQSRPGIYSSYSPKDLPEKTAGELLKAASKNHRDSIQRQKVEDKWEEVQESPKMRSISDNFTDALKKAMGK